MAQAGFGKAKMQLLKPRDQVRQALRLRCRLEDLCGCGSTAPTARGNMGLTRKNHVRRRRAESTSSLRVRRLSNRRCASV